MQHAPIEEITFDEFQSDYDSYLLNRGLSHQTVKLHRLVLRKFFLWRFPTRCIRLDDIRFDDFAQFLAREFERLRHRESQRVWLMVLRSLLRFLAQRGHIHTSDRTEPSADCRQPSFLQLWRASAGFVC